MSFIIKKRRQLPPPPPICLDKDAKDRFGLPVYLPTLLGETSEMRAARISATKRLIQDAVDSAVTQLGRREVRRLINLALKMPPKGKSADRQLNDDLLAAYYREKSAAPDEIKSIPRRIAQEFYKQKETQKKIHSVAALERQVRRLVKEREEFKKADPGGVLYDDDKTRRHLESISKRTDI